MPLSTEQLLPFRTSNFLHISSILLVRILVKIFRRVSNSVMSLVLSMSILQSVALEIGMILALFHSLGVLPMVTIRLKSFIMANKTASGLSFQHSYVILEGPAALLFGKLLIASTTSPMVISALTESKVSSLIDWSGSYSSSQAGS